VMSNDIMRAVSHSLKDIVGLFSCLIARYCERTVASFEGSGERSISGVQVDFDHSHLADSALIPGYRRKVGL
jgi:hypothetical protein